MAGRPGYRRSSELKRSIEVANVHFVLFRDAEGALTRPERSQWDPRAGPRQIYRSKPTAIRLPEGQHGSWPSVASGAGGV